MPSRAAMTRLLKGPTIVTQNSFLGSSGMFFSIETPPIGSRVMLATSAP